MGDTVTIVFDAATQGFEAGTKKIGSAIKSFSNGVTRSMNGIKQASNGVLRTMMKWGPALLGITGVYQVISRATQAFMSENQALQAQMSSIWSALGNLIGPIIQQLVSWLSQAVAYLLQFLSILGVASAGAKKAGAAAGGAAQELKRTVAGFDELNLLQDQGGGGGGGANGKLPEVQLSEFMEKLAEALKQGLWDDAANMIIEKFNGLIQTFHDAAYGFGKKAGYYLAGAFTIIGRVLNETDWSTLGGGIAQFFNGILDKLNEDNVGRHIGEIMVAGITIAIKMVTGFLQELDPKALATTFNDIVTGALDALISAIEGANWQQIGNNIKTFLENVNWAEIGEKIGELLKTAWEAAWQILLGAMGKGTDDELPIVQKFEKLKDAIERFAEAARPAVERVVEIIKELGGLIGPILDGLSGALNGVSATLETVHGVIEGKITAADLWEKAKAGWNRFVNGADEAEQATNEVGDAVDRVSEKSQSTHVSGTFEDITAGAEEAKGATEEAAETVQNLVLTADEIAAIAESANEAGAAVDATKAKLDESTEEWMTLKDNIVDTMTGIKEAVVENFDESQKKSEESAKEIQETLSESMDELNTEVDDKLGTIYETFESRMTELASSASGWGSDLMSNFISGIESQMSYLQSVCANVAATVAAYIHFSEPDKGPLANFHTFAPDMMKMFAGGIKDNIGVVEGAIGNVAQKVSDTMSGIDPASLMEKVNAMSSFAYSAPAIATGTVMPYGVSSSGMNGGIGGNSESFMQTLGQQIYSAVSSAMAERGGVGGDVRTAVFNIDGREFMRATFNAQNAVANEHGVSLIIK